METNSLYNCPHVISVNKLELEDKLQHIADLECTAEVIDQLKRVEIYRIFYKVKNLQVVGFVVYPKQAINLPSIVSLRGGSRDFGMITEKYLVRAVLPYADLGYVLITTQYPGVDGGTGEDTFGGEDDLDSIKVLKNILDWIPQANSSLIALKGHSRGGLMTYMMLREVDWVKAAIIGAGPTDEFRAGKEREGWREHQIKMFGESDEALLRRSPIKWVNELPKNVPILIMHGSSDWRVLPDHSIQMSLEMYKHKIPHRFVLFEGADHGISEFIKEYKEQSSVWLKRYLTDEMKLPNMELHGE